MESPLIFLDIDGVLNDRDFCGAAMCGQIQRDKVRLLNRAIEATNAKVVLTSAWRYIILRGEATLGGLDWLLRSHGLLANSLIGHTRADTLVPPLTWDGSTPWPPLPNERGAQISDYLAVNNNTGPYVAIDDLDLGITAAGHPLILTDGKIGLQEQHVIAIIKALRNGQKN